MNQLQHDNKKQIKTEEKLQPEKPTPAADYVRKRRRMRVVCACACACALIFAAGIFLHVHNMKIARGGALVQQVAQVTESTNLTTSSKDTAKQLYAPRLVALLGKTAAEAQQALGAGAQVTGTTQENNAGSAIRQKTTIALTNESGNALTGTPTVVLALDSQGKVIQASFSVNLTLMGYGFISFSDAVLNRHVIETTLSEAGLNIEVGHLKLPDNHSDYATYDKDGITISKEEYTFSGHQVQNGTDYLWRGTLSFDYTLSNAQSNLSYTQRSVTVTVGTQE